MNATTTLETAADKLTADGYSPQWFSGGGLYIAEGDDGALAAIRALLGDGYRCDWTGDEDDIGIEVAE